tara:strand:+ start:2654 stop:3451 length:798 start_codon:yes stop_codon:yes gene_type:complete
VDKEVWFEALNISCFKNGNRVLKNLNLKLKNSENVLLLGPNGSGKSSLIELINRNIYPVIENETVMKIFDKELINIWELRKRISTVNNEIKFRINPKLKVFDLILSGLFGKYCHTSNISKLDNSKVETLIRQMKIDDLSQKYYSYLSDGEKQIVLIARALINNPEILILDEPTANLDYKSKFFVMDKIDQLSKLKTIILCVTHEVSMITNIYDRILMLKNGTIIADGSQMEVINSSNINKLFNINSKVKGNKGNWVISRNLENND